MMSACTAWRRHRPNGGCQATSHNAFLCGCPCMRWFCLSCSQLEGMDVRSVGNSQALKDTALIEAFNLKAAIELMLKNNAAAAEALADMPPRCAPHSGGSICA